MFRCPCDECNISHMITCGLISPEVNEHHHHHHHHNGDGVECQQAPDHNSSDIASSEDVMSKLSPSHIPQPLSCHHDQLRRYCANIKPPSIPSSSDSSCSESPIILDRCRFFGEDFEYVTFHFVFVYHLVRIFTCKVKVITGRFVKNQHFKMFVSE